MDHAGEPDPVSVQIAGYDPAMLADAARHNVDHGAQIIDINMGCPAKKVCNVWPARRCCRTRRWSRGSSPRWSRAVDVPVTLKIRTGWNRDDRNAVAIARIAEDSGIAALAVHGRTRDDLYHGEAEYDTIAAIKAAVRIPVIANGDIDSPRKRAHVLEHTGADAVMIGRAAQGRPWIFREIAHFLATGETCAGARRARGPRHPARPPRRSATRSMAKQQGVRIARKHLGWYAKDRPENAAFRAVVNRAESATEQLRLTRDYFDALAAQVVRDGVRGRGLERQRCHVDPAMRANSRATAATRARPRQHDAAVAGSTRGCARLKRLRASPTRCANAYRRLTTPTCSVATFCVAVARPSTRATTRLIARITGVCSGRSTSQNRITRVWIAAVLRPVHEGFVEHDVLAVAPRRSLRHRRRCGKRPRSA